MRYFVIGGIIRPDPVLQDEKERLQNVCMCLGQALRDFGHTLVICSPFIDSADYWAFNGFVHDKPKDNNSIEFHYVDMETVRTEISNLEPYTNSHRIAKIPYPPPSDNEQESSKYAWLLCQLQALESCQAIVAIGGKLNGSANMLLLFAEAKRKLILPFSFMGGAAGQSFHRRRYELEDKLGSGYILLQDEKNLREVLKLSEEVYESHVNSVLTGNPLSFFISYARARPSEADYIETLLRRRNMQVFRDESDFGAGHAILTEINEAIYAANVFIVVWCVEYACSPWCFDELELALDRHDSGKMKLWIFCTDDTRIVPIRARNLICYPVRTREEIEGTILKLINNEGAK